MALLDLAKIARQTSAVACLVVETAQWCRAMPDILWRKEDKDCGDGGSHGIGTAKVRKHAKIPPARHLLAVKCCSTAPPTLYTIPGTQADRIPYERSALPAENRCNASFSTNANAKRSQVQQHLKAIITAAGHVQTASRARRHRFPRRSASPPACQMHVASCRARNDHLQRDRSSRAAFEHESAMTRRRAGLCLLRESCSSRAINRQAQSTPSTTRAIRNEAGDARKIKSSIGIDTGIRRAHLSAVFLAQKRVPRKPPTSHCVPTSSTSPSVAVG